MYLFDMQPQNIEEYSSIKPYHPNNNFLEYNQN